MIYLRQVLRTGFLILLLFGAACNDSNNPVGFPSAQITTPDLVNDPATFTASNNTITVRGRIISSSPSIFNSILAANPDVDTIVLENVPGTFDTDASFSIGRTIRSNGFRTHVPSGGLVASGGTDIFVSGVARTLDSGGFIGVHSWETDTTAGQDLPESNPLHTPFVDYYREMGISDDFYWFAINSAPSNSVHWMTATEIQQYGLLNSGVQ